ncbi:hypothetical protein [Merdimonas faecis]
MERKVWRRPLTEVQKFEANEYVAACGDSGVVYNFECNAGNRRDSYNVYYDDGRPLASSNGNEEWYAQFTGYHPCHAIHTAESDSGFYDGYMYLQDWRGNNTGNPIDVVIWTDRGTNVHCTTNLDMDSWETEKS